MMIKSIASLAAVAALSLSAQAAPAGQSIGIQGSVVNYTDISVSGLDLNGNDGTGITVPLGFDLGNGLSGEISVGYYQGDYDGEFFGESLNADLTLVPVMFSVGYSHALGADFSAYVAAGAGIVYGKAEISSGDISASGTSWDLGLQARAGISYSFSEGVSANVGYRALLVADDDDIVAHGVELGLTLNF
jgi:opacity protein-like surface antigen